MKQQRCPAWKEHVWCFRPPISTWNSPRLTSQSHLCPPNPGGCLLHLHYRTDSARLVSHIGRGKKIIFGKGTHLRKKPKQLLCCAGRETPPKKKKGKPRIPEGRERSAEGNPHPSASLSVRANISRSDFSTAVSPVPPGKCEYNVYLKASLFFFRIIFYLLSHSRFVLAGLIGCKVSYLCHPVPRLFHRYMMNRYNIYCLMYLISHLYLFLLKYDPNVIITS